ncbi:TBC domain-containing protein [Truncatella angustata]|uniref:TBC domain-containing protein n=1 Tax=Truncatella angustata TaxID=152316 RepID=A0A9P8UXH7_9PEZI|nr:TBC domain-containing protein [Truncatella angustata]KAH6660037.1 TBC domain-containing protein [Truncatella angustata]KAH8196782.1 hypothetical protein TruAng_009053 [Truncatella angustata]
MSSPTRESAPSLTPSLITELHAPPSPRTHRQLRKLQSAHNLGAAARVSAGQPPGLITQQRFRELQARDVSPTRRAFSNRSPQRARANSDVPSPVNLITSHGTMNSRQRFVMNKTSPAADALSLERLIRDGPPDSDMPGALESARLKVLDQGVKSDSDGMSPARIYVWLIFLNAPVLETDAYLALIHRGASPAYSKIRNDTFRTLTTDPLFRRRVSEASLIRLLNAVAWKLQDAKELKRPPSSRHSLPYTDSSNNGSRPSTANTGTSSPAAKNRARALTLTTEGDSDHGAQEPGTYVQGMNVLAAPFLYAARSEVEAYVAFHRLLTSEVPGYIRGAMTGVHRGLELVDKVLAIVDVKLHLHLVNTGLSAKIYAFPSVLTLCACTPPLPEVLRLWDFLFAYGPHLNIVCIVAQLVMMRTDLLKSLSPNKLLRSFPALNAEAIKKTALALVNRLPDDVYDEIVRHAL